MKVTVRERQEAMKTIEDSIVEIKEDIEQLFELGEFSQLGLYDLYQKLDALSESIEAVVTLDLTDPVAKT